MVQVQYTHHEPRPISSIPSSRCLYVPVSPWQPPNPQFGAFLGPADCALLPRALAAQYHRPASELMQKPLHPWMLTVLLSPSGSSLAKSCLENVKHRDRSEHASEQCTCVMTRPNILLISVCGADTARPPGPLRHGLTEDRPGPCVLGSSPLSVWLALRW